MLPQAPHPKSKFLAAQSPEFMGIFGANEANVAFIQNFTATLIYMLASPRGAPEELREIVTMGVRFILGGDVIVSHQETLWLCQEV